MTVSVVTVTYNAADTVADAVARYKGAPGDEGALRRSVARPARLDAEPPLTGEAPLSTGSVRVTRSAARRSRG